jgi:hypothetical protein
MNTLFQTEKMVHPMLRTLVLALLLAAFCARPASVHAQCITAPPPEECTGSEPSPGDNETLPVGIKKYYYGAPAVFNSLKLDGGTLVVCSDLTINNFTMDSGIVFIRPGARLRIGGGAGLMLKGNAAIYNFGTFECSSNFNLDPNWATPEKPNIVYNDAGGIFKMSNQYFVVTNANSYFINNGYAEFWGLITDYNAGKNTVCLGDKSTMSMAFLLNNTKHAYTASSGFACIYVFQGSQNRDTLTTSNRINICLGSSHSPLGCGGCPVVGWGAAQVFPACDACTNITILPLRMSDLAVTASHNDNRLTWKTNMACNEYVFYTERSVDGKPFMTISTVPGANEASYVYAAADHEPPAGTAYYRVRAVHTGTKQEYVSAIVKVSRNDKPVRVSVSPNPTTGLINIRWNEDREPQAIIITNLAGAVVYQRSVGTVHGNNITVQLPASMPRGQYVLKMVYRNEVVIQQLTRM